MYTKVFFSGAFIIYIYIYGFAFFWAFNKQISLYTLNVDSKMLIC